MKKWIITTLFLSVVLSSFVAHAEEVILKDGKKIEGTITARTTQFIKIDIGVGVELTYYLDQVDSIDGVFIKISDDSFVSLDPLSDINENADSLAVDIADESYKLINNIDTQKVTEKMDPSSPKTISPFDHQPDDITYTEENDQMDEFKRFERFHYFIEVFDWVMKHIKTSRFPFLIVGSTIVLFLILWVVSCWPLVLMSRTLGLQHQWMAFVPFFQIVLFIQLAGVPVWWLVLFFIPIVNFFIPLILWFKIAEALGRPTWMAFLMYVPIVNIIVLWYFAFSKKPEKRAFRF